MEFLRSSLETWLETTKELVIPRIILFEATSGPNSLCGSEDIRQQIARVEVELAEWKGASETRYE